VVNEFPNEGRRLVDGEDDLINTQRRGRYLVIKWFKNCKIKNNNIILVNLLFGLVMPAHIPSETPSLGGQTRHLDRL
jgi:hypothetical protein